MINRKLSRILGPVLGSMVFITSLSIGQVKVLADDKGNDNSVALKNAICHDYKDYSININKSVEQNGFKVTLDKVTGTKHNLNVVLKVESDKPIDKEKTEKFISEVTLGNSHSNNSCIWFDYLDDKSFIMHLNGKNHEDKEKFPEKGELRVDLALPNYKVNVGIDAYVDFSKSFKKMIQEKIATKIPEFNLVLDELESNVVGTRFKCSGTYDEKNNEEKDSVNSFLILKKGNIMYRLSSDGFWLSDGEVEGEYIANSATYDRIKDTNDLSIIPIVGHMSYEEMYNMYEKDKENIFNDKDKEILNNVKYKKSFEFSDGNKGEIYNIERKDNKIRVYCKGSTEKAGFLMASNMVMYDEPNKETESFNNTYDGSKYMSFYKNPNDELGYIVEFGNVKDNKLKEIHFDCTTSEIDKYEIGNEVEISK
ncbi:DUF4179 domain-containing protein [Clostridium taeniosporum]|uniref:DUF4179 domain-containing protein n=1 Tax=Clostridium taeniosporum TaxID=394958 RepID=A0A1D7XKC2_9CLOT|nr:DUF4179 domain-containing protein [Clostridium taeniosporum]AOR23798.1 hypothetical protein BGI42_08690 [Clostridium taeniosporum]